METMSMVQVLVVEDSMTTRRFLVDLINNIPGMMVVAEAEDGLQALRLVEELKPDVISMDIQMPNMDGLQATQHIMANTPTPIVIVSAGLGQREVDYAMLAIEAGALAAIDKPTATPQDQAKRTEYLRLLRLMAGVSVVRRRALDQLEQQLDSLPNIQADDQNLPDIVVIGASAGGPGALTQVLSYLPEDFPLPVLVTQHLSADFVPGLANWLGRRCVLPVRLALEGEYPQPGEVWIAPGGYHMQLSAEGRVLLTPDKGHYRHQPSVDALFDSVANVYGRKTIAVLLTGMGDDGAAGMERLFAFGARTIVQNEETCVVYGMPGAAVERGAAEYILPLGEIGRAITRLAQPSMNYR
ncbi:MAG: chemotaxis-specific protein-glutamate methyltransferase CheB [Chloroflexi bacterium]|nr:chemotaxis-specific protein-glutamate methyltransferase CheB [Chloroflexota bacterium]